MKSIVHLIQELQRREGQGSIERLAEAADYALSPRQERRYLDHNVEESAGTDLICRAIEIRGDLQLPLLQAALDAIVKRH